MVKTKDVSIHALVKRVTARYSYLQMWQVSFNPRPREEGDVAAATMAIGAFAVSIHALVKRATNVIMDFPEIQNVSIHALVKRATVSEKVKKGAKLGFNPRPHEEGDHRRYRYFYS